MKHLTVVLFVLNLMSLNVSAQSTSLTGAWQLNDGNEKHYLFFQDGFCFHTVQADKDFAMSQGGTYEVTGGDLKIKILYHSADSTKVGQNMTIPFSLPGDQLALQVDQGDANFTKIDDGKSELAGVWRITGRMAEDGKVAEIHQTGSRQTYKMLTGSMFQWVAIDPDKKQFSGTGGGAYTFKDGKYTENIKFFSRDNSRLVLHSPSKVNL